ASINVGPGGADIDGDYGTLHINPDGSYTYTVFDMSFGGASAKLNPLPSDVSGMQSSFTKNGITVKSGNGADLAWVNEDGSGIGVAGGTGGNKIFTGEKLEVDFAAADKVTVT